MSNIKDYIPGGFWLDEPPKDQNEPAYFNFLYKNKDTKEIRQVKIASDQPMDDDTLKLLVMLNLCYMKLEREVFKSVEAGNLDLVEWDG